MRDLPPLDAPANDRLTRWFGPAVFHVNLGERPKRFRRWLYPSRHERSRITFLGWCFIFLTFGIGSAAYNSSNNLLFVALSLLFASFILSGVLSWVNFRIVAWRLHAPCSARVGEPSVARIELRNFQKHLPSIGLFAEVSEENGTGASEKPARFALQGSLAPGATGLIPVTYLPERRGKRRLNLVAVGSLFPFGFLRKALLAEASVHVLVRPARLSSAAPLSELVSYADGDREAPRSGHGSDLLHLRDYTRGDNPRRIHWKASARAGKWLVREHSSEASPEIILGFSIAASIWHEPLLFERLCSAAATLAEDLHRAGRLQAVLIGADLRFEIRTHSDLESLLDHLAVIEPKAGAGSPPEVPSLLRLIPGPEGKIAVVSHEQLVALL